MTVHIDAYGNASLREGPAGFSLEGSRLTLSDEPIRLSFAKADGCGNALSGALFSVTGVFADDQGHLLNEGQATTLEGLDVSALSALHFVQGQTYALEETQAPTGYELISGSLRFVVGADGKVSLDGSGVSNGSHAVSADGVAITAVDEPIEAQVTKVSSVDGTALAGATFTLSPADGTLAAGEGPKAYELLCDGQVGVRVSDDSLPEPEAAAEPQAPGVVPGGSGAAPFTGDATSSATACLLLAGGLALVASGLRRRRRGG